jgi:hypothetical protein
MLLTRTKWGLLRILARLALFNVAAQAETEE